MTNLQDLRDTLRSHADLDDHAGTTRAAAVHDRVRGVHRRRRAALAGGAAAVLIGVVGLNLPDKQDAAPAGPGDPVAPKTLTSTGYTYELQATTTGEHDVTLRIPKSDQPRLISWGTDGGAADPVRIKPPAAEAFTSAEAAFTDFYLVHPGESGNLRITEAQGDLSVSTYTLTGAAPDGTTKDDITYRSTVGSRRLVGATIGDLGDTEIELDLAAPRGPVQIANLCSGLGSAYRVNASFGDEGSVSHGACDDATFDPGASANIGLDRLAEPEGDVVTMRVWISRRGGDTPVAPSAETSAVRLGLGVYTDDPAFGGVTDSGQPVRVESRGRTWEVLEESGATGPGASTVALAGAGPHLATVGFRGSEPVRYTYFATFEGQRRPVGESAWFDTSGGEGSTGEILIPQHAESFSVEVAGGAAPDLRTTVTIYQRVG